MTKRAILLTLALSALVSRADEGETTVLKPGQRKEVPGLSLTAHERYRISFEALADGPDTVENNAHVAAALRDRNRRAHGLRLASWEYRFYDASGKMVGGGFGSDVWRVVVSSKWRKYQEVFFGPSRAVTMKVIFINGTPDTTTSIRNLKLEPYSEPTLNVNADFSLGVLCHSGFGNSDVYMEKTPGGVVMCVPTYAIGEGFPVTGGRRYVVSVELAEKPRTNPMVGVGFSDAKGKGIGECGGVFWVDPVKVEKQFKAPADAVTMSISISKGARDIKFKSIKVLPCE